MTFLLDPQITNGILGEEEKKKTHAFSSTIIWWQRLDCVRWKHVNSDDGQPSVV